MHVGGDQVHAACSRALFSCPACTMLLLLPNITRRTCNTPELSRPSFGLPKMLPLQARSLGMWSSAVQLVNAREQARARREQALREGADEPAMQPAVAWTPSRDVNLGPRWGQGCELVIGEGAGQKWVNVLSWQQSAHRHCYTLSQSGSGPARTVWRPSACLSHRACRWCCRPRDATPSLFDLAMWLVVRHIEDVESLWGIPDIVKVG